MHIASVHFVCGVYIHPFRWEFLWMFDRRDALRRPTGLTLIRVCLFREQFFVFCDPMHARICASPQHYAPLHNACMLHPILRVLVLRGMITPCVVLTSWAP